MYTKTYRSATIRGKLKVCRFLQNNASTKPLIPSTTSFTLSNLKMMAAAHHALYIKPNIGSLGVGVHKLEPINGSYELIYTKNKKQLSKIFSSLTDVYDNLKPARPSRFIIQQAISLDQVENRPYDIRAMVQRKPGGIWTFTGFLIKVGAKGKIVTNYHQGGEIWTMQKLLQRKGYEDTQRTELISHLTQRSLTVARALSKHKADMFEMSVDFAWDRNKHLWILEVNSNHPQFRPLKWIDRRAYNRILRFARSYGRNDD
ncbi:YheC/D like ATP-grasp [Paenibacillus algorifonticola]|uniref:YheC/D like ATP-grasp n=1 Tax=Paenibacillus algorifonticola TaxID=684063 RepID=A0A1I2IGG0_9BACL|nr:YheC/YheD family protein [Paenibacillus algorifonticola]SFF40743.1 YheC/D like ATP-grasp [Paenibacillus algorifonticola]